MEAIPWIRLPAITVLLLLLHHPTLTVHRRHPIMQVPIAKAVQTMGHRAVPTVATRMAAEVAALLMEVEERLAAVNVWVWADPSAFLASYRLSGGLGH